ncbi:hypothetical protein [Oceanithermus desulfurans]|uniref:Uncharacterized protein n=1 Tax=Oceanithermus desulfurans NBRC 100063 TaxID=1227550 RepID=A0A511RLH0_9DEIN|nr:hypothetical protein [Oceanithermus desulfurans]GEM90495.1 hypothetical protein ODE01S_19290 [Oceanithermus desulfurans NBRC 100063]
MRWLKYSTCLRLGRYRSLMLLLLVFALWEQGSIGFLFGMAQNGECLHGNAVIPPSGGGVGLPGNEVYVSVAPDTIQEPIRIRIEKVTPEDAPGPITEGVTVIKGVRISLPDADYSQRPYPGLFKGRPLAVRFKAEGFVEEPNLFGDYYTAVCFWDDFEGRGTFGKLRWACSYGAESKIVELDGQRYYVYWLHVIPEAGATSTWCSTPRSFPGRTARRSGASLLGTMECPCARLIISPPSSLKKAWGRGSKLRKSHRIARVSRNE